VFSHFSDLFDFNPFGSDSGAPSGCQVTRIPNAALEISNLTEASSNIMKNKQNPRFPTSYVLIPIFVIIGFVIHNGNYIHPLPPVTYKGIYAVVPYKSIYAVNSLQAYFATDFWRTYGVAMGIIFLLGTIFLPRITMWWFAVVIPPNAVLSLGWVIAPRTTVAFLTTTVYWHTNPEICIVAWLAAYAGASFKTNWARDHWRENGDDIIVRLGVVAVIGVVLGGLYLVLFLVVKLFQYFVAGIYNTNAIVGSIIGVLVLGSVLYVFRYLYRMWYGILEIISALVLAWYTIARTIKPGATIADLDIFAAVLALSSSIYIVVRGLDNIGEKNLKKLLIKAKPLLERITLLTRIRK
jgi:hypothetical protein